MYFSEASDHLSGRLNFFYEFVRKFMEIEVAEAAAVAAQTLLGLSQTEADRFGTLLPQLVRRLDEAAAENQLRFAIVYQADIIRKLTQLSLEMHGVIPYQAIPTPEDLHALEVVAGFTGQLGRLALEMRFPK